VNKLLPIL